MLRIKDRARIWTCFLTTVLTLCASVADARNVTFAWNSNPTWQVGTTVELEANGTSANGITASQHTLDVPVQPGEVINARVRAIPPSGYECGDPLALCQPSPWATLVQTVPPVPTGVWARYELQGGLVMARPVLDTSNISVSTATTAARTFAHTVPSGTNLLVVVLQGWVTGESAPPHGDSPSNITWNGTALTRIALSGGWGKEQHGIWYLVSPAATTANIVVSGGDPTLLDGGVVKALNFSSVDTTVGTSGIRSVVNTQADSRTTITLSPTTSANDLIVADWSQQSSTVTTGQTYGGTSGTQTVRHSIGYNYDAVFLTTSQPTASGQTVTFFPESAGNYPSGLVFSIAGTAGATTNTSTTSINALVQKTGITATSSLSALLQKSFSGNVGIDSLIASVKSGDISIDALLQATNKSATVSVDGLVQAVKTGAVSIDAAVAIIVAVTSGVDALLQSSFNATAGLDAIVSGSSTVTASLDGLIQSGKSTTALIDALLQAGYLSQIDIDAIIAKAFSSTASIDALLQAVATTSTGLDAILSGGISASVVLDALLQAGAVSTASIDALLQKSLSSTVSLDAFVQGSASAVASLDALVQATKTSALSMDAIIVSAGQALATTSLDGLLQAIKSGALSLDAMIAVPVAGATAGLDALLSVTGVSTVSIGALLQAAKTGIISIDGLIQSAKTAQVSIDGLVQAAKAGTTSLDSLVGIIGSSIVSLDAIIQKSRASGIFLDAIIGLISAIIMPTGRVISIASTDRSIVISETDRFIVIPNSDRSVLN
jgi:hypothetical protein